MAAGVEGMHLAEVLTVLDALTAARVPFWVTGGWGVDLLAGSQTRPHRDLDIDINAAHEAVTLEVLETLGYSVETDWRPTRVEVVSKRGWVDIHPLQFDGEGNARQAAPDGTFWHWPHRYFTTSLFEGRSVGCYTVEGQRFFRLDYEPRPQDLLDLAQLDRLDRPAETEAPPRSSAHDQNSKPKLRHHQDVSAGR